MSKNTELVCISFDTGEVNRYVNKIRTHRTRMVEPLTGEDLAAIEEFRVTPDRRVDYTPPVPIGGKTA